MSKQLLEQNFITFDLRTLGQTQADVEAEVEEVNEPADDTAEPEVAATDEPANDTNNDEPVNDANDELTPLPGKGEWDKWKELLDQRIADNNKLSATEKKTQYEVESRFFRDFFVENWDRNIGAKLLLIGENLRKAIKVLGFNPAKNPILGFIRQTRVINDLIYTGKLNIETFKAIYNAVAYKLVTSNELIKEKAAQDEYNIIYCLDLYNKPVKDMIEYLKVQSNILTVSSTQYDADKQLKNKRAFIDVGEKIAEQEEGKRAVEINKTLDHSDFANIKMVNAKLNTLTLAKEVANIKESYKTELDSKGQDELVTKLSTVADKFAAIFLLSTTTDSPKAKSYLNNEHFESLSSDDKLVAVMSLAAKSIMPKGQLNKNDADSLADKIIASLQQKPE